MRSRATALTAALLLATLTACSGSGDDSTTVTKSDKTEAAPTSTPTTPSPEPSKSQTTFAIGETADINDEENGAHFTASVIAYTQPEKGPEAALEGLGGEIWATAEVKVCNTKGVTFSVSQFPWSLEYKDGTRIEVTGLNGGDMPKPEFPTDDVSVKEGRCVRGKIPFPVPSAKRPERIVYAPQSLPEPIDWTVPKA
ncbi:DUF4352 domain-containing protein [Streptomyces sp. PKU-EA00015]|uniref:DUF4352 domain-containing protein n=1 Tax=Streptomyces sp. PKU-EA00015 TaxID=2748326 RepID=UPI0015A473A2|nr:DUF4352 domain-containing protein [Streptomyces sp. PKU-EA00015]NWF28483.1 DUF4352 domain-containing protein [Streptomyces sp. PKU-EA00015]